MCCSVSDYNRWKNDKVPNISMLLLKYGRFLSKREFPENSDFYARSASIKNQAEGRLTSIKIDPNETKNIPVLIKLWLCKTFAVGFFISSILSNLDYVNIQSYQWKE